MPDQDGSLTPDELRERDRREAKTKDKDHAVDEAMGTFSVAVGVALLILLWQLYRYARLGSWPGIAVIDVMALAGNGWALAYRLAGSTSRPRHAACKPDYGSTGDCSGLALVPYTGGLPSSDIVCHLHSTCRRSAGDRPTTSAAQIRLLGGRTGIPCCDWCACVFAGRKD